MQSETTVISQKIKAGSEMPKLSRAGGGVVKVGDSTGWQIVIVYRGKHCPICRTYLKTLDGLLEQFGAADTEVIAISGDPKEKAESEVNEESWHFPVGYDLRPDQMRQLGLYISEPRSPQEANRPFAEPDFSLSIRRARFRWSISQMRRSLGPSLAAF